MRGQEQRARTLIALAVVGLGVAHGVASTFVVGRRYPDLFRERLRPGPGAKEGWPQELALYGIPLVAHPVVAVLDLGRFHWSRPVPLRLQVAALFGYAAALGLLLWTTTVNPFFASAIRIQRERGQRVITTGPYRVVRHPGYAAAVVMLVAGALALGSRYALVPAVLFTAAITYRTRLEDRVLHAELEGYAAYARRVRHRLLPGVW